MHEMHREQRCTVSSFYPPGWHGGRPYEAVPFLFFAGSWLRDAGFSSNTEVLVKVEQGRLVVTLRPEEEL